MIKNPLSDTNIYKSTDGWVMCQHCGTVWRAVLAQNGRYTCPSCYKEGGALVPPEYFYCAGQFEE